MDGHAALLWTRYLAAQLTPNSRPMDRARQAGRFAARAVDRLAPLPFAAEAARHGLEVGRQLEIANPAAALVVYAEVRAALDRTRASRWRGLGLAGLAAEARALEQGARTRATAAPTPSPVLAASRPAGGGGRSR